MGVFRTAADGLELATMVDFALPAGGGGGGGGPPTPFKPSSLMLHQADRALLVLDAADPTAVHRMDLERGAIVDTWRGGAAGGAATGGRATRSGRAYASPAAAAAAGGTPIAALQRSEKYAHLTPEAGFVGLNARALLRMDPRDPAFIVQSKTYAARTTGGLTAMATTGGGHVAAASAAGDVRLYDGIGKRAKTLLPGLGVPITAVDVTADGRWVLATTATYLLLVDTRLPGGASAFERPAGAAGAKPPPRRLALRPVDVVAHRMGAVAFTAARFNTGDGVERSIVTSTGPFVVTWNFRKVKQGHADAYSVRRYADTVVADDFAFNDDGKIVVALPDDVTLNAYRR